MPRSSFFTLIGACCQRYALAVFSLTGLVGCGGLEAGPKSPLADNGAALSELQKGFAPAEVTACLVTPLQEQTVCRDRISQSLMVAIDLRYADYELTFFDNNRYGSLASTLAVLGLTGAGSVSGAAAAKALSAAAAGLTGAREAFDREVLLQSTTVSLQTAMRGQRDIVAARIRAGIAQPASQYPLGVALSDLYAYYRAGTLPGALSGVSQAVGVQAEAAQAQLANPLPIQRAPAGRFLQQIVMSGSPAAKAALRTEMSSAGVPTPDAAAFAYTGDPTLQAAVARKLGWTP